MFGSKKSTDEYISNEHSNVTTFVHGLYSIL